MPLKNWIKKLIPDYAAKPLLLAVAANFIIYVGVSQIREYLSFRSLALPVDDRIPFFAPFIIFYILAYVQWIANYLLIAREGKDFCYHFVYGDVISKLFCLVFFLFLPTTLVRPEVTGNGICERLVRLIYQIDAPVNLFPSIHCLESWCCIHAAFCMKKTPRWYLPLTIIMSLCVFASTLLVKQHVFIDVFGGILVFEIGYFLAGKKSSVGDKAHGTFRL